MTGRSRRFGHRCGEILSGKALIAARPVLDVRGSGEASLEMLENGLPLSLPDDPIDQVAETFLDGRLYRTRAVKSPAAVELEH
ncbi:hypothetical protein FJV80_27375 [Mesorhizobium sp. WSM4310]|uniref:hypothetical protein n=1 Tax=Mesorhizobium sp. WSM4310 TaxID=2589883 RepID=UPI00115DEC68|nr:hypothetical protein [Mesorhizobium sp. WSM4310]TRC75788.1 hypothetical protein FJV80_27375 [Mesorhizobium sp. WSM4310]